MNKERLINDFIAEIKVRAYYWEGQNVSSKEKLDGLISSFLAIIDGSTNLPRFILVAVQDDEPLINVNDEVSLQRIFLKGKN